MNYRATVLWENGASVRLSANAGGTPLGTLSKNAVFEIDGTFPDTTDPSNPKKLWGRISPNNTSFVGRYVALLYPSSSSAYIRCTWEEIVVTPPPPPPPPNSEVVRTHVIEVFNDGSITVDGNPVV